jgi:hypothetical protein
LKWSAKPQYALETNNIGNTDPMEKNNKDKWPKTYFLAKDLASASASEIPFLMAS